MTKRQYITTLSGLRSRLKISKQQAIRALHDAIKLNQQIRANRVHTP